MLIERKKSDLACGNNSQVEIASDPLSSYEKIDIRPLTPTEQLNFAVHDLAEQINERIFIPHLTDEEGMRLGPAPDCILTIQSFGRSKGFAAKTVWSDNYGQYLDQITLIFRQHHPGDVKDIAGTLAHEMMHAKQFHDGKSGVRNYHNRQFSNWMKSIGIQTSQTGKPGGAEIGTGMRQYIIDGGPFDRVIDEIIAAGFEFPWEATGAFGDVDGGDASTPPIQAFEFPPPHI